MDDQTKEQLGQRYGFDDWESSSVLVLTTTGIAVQGAELDGWTAQRVDSITVPESRAAYQSIWRSADRTDVLLQLDLFEMGDAGSARGLLLQLLGQFQSPWVEQRRPATVGEVMFSVPGDTAVVFTRANVVAMVRSAGREVVPAIDFAQRLDQTLARQADQSGPA